jgi:hypothetical protein
LCLKEGEELEELGRAFLEVSRIANRTYELTILDQK